MIHLRGGDEHVHQYYTQTQNSPVCDFDGVGQGHDTGNTSHPAVFVVGLVRVAAVTRVTVRHGYRAGETVSGVTLQGFEL